MVAELTLGETRVAVVFKDVKNVHLSVYPPNGHVRIAAPFRMSLENIRVYAISRLDWIRKQQNKMREQERESPREYIERESHFVWGRRYLMQIVEADAAPKVELKHRKLVLQVRPGASEEARQSIVARWYRDQLRLALPELLQVWEPKVGVRVARIFVQKMKTKWGSCNSETRSIRLNSDLAKKPIQCLEYILVHELVHLIERHHNDRFSALLDGVMPMWRHHRAELNRSPLAHEDWKY